MARLVSLQVGSVQLAWVNLVHLHSVQLSSNLLGLRFCHPLNPPYPSTPSPRTHLPQKHTLSWAWLPSVLRRAGSEESGRRCCQEEVWLAGVRDARADCQTSTSGLKRREQQLPTPQWQFVLLLSNVINYAVFCLDFLGLRDGKHENKPLNVAFRVSSGSALRTATLWWLVDVGQVTEQESNWFKKELSPWISFTSLHVKCMLQSSHVDRKCAHFMFISRKIFPLGTTLRYLAVSPCDLLVFFSVVVLKTFYFKIKKEKLPSLI